MTEFIKAEDGRYINVDYIFEFIPFRGGTAYEVRYAGKADDERAARAVVDNETAHKVAFAARRARLQAAKEKDAAFRKLHPREDVEAK